MSLTNSRYGTTRHGGKVFRRVRTSEDEGDFSEMDEIPLMLCDEGYDMDENHSLMRRKQYRWPNQSLSDSICNCFASCCNCLAKKCGAYKELKPRRVYFGKASGQPHEKFPRNVVKNQKYNFFTFIPLVLFEQFKFFLNFFFLVMACLQFVPELRIGYLYTYWVPLGFVIFVSLLREFLDDFRRFRQDREANSQKYVRLTAKGQHPVPSSEIRVGDLIRVDKDQRVPADMVLLRTTEKSGASFLRTDQLDGETDWKLRLAIQATQNLPSDEALFEVSGQIYAEKPQRDIHQFVGTFTCTDDPSVEDSLSIENTMWANTVVASGTALGVVVYTGKESRSVMNTSQPKYKVGLLDMEINTLTKVLFMFVTVLSIVMMVLKGFDGPWFRYLIRFILLFSYIIPISLRVNLDMGKAVYSWMIQRDKEIPDTVVRCTTIPEELGRITYLMSDKTGTLTQNEMVFKRLHLGTVSYTSDTLDDIKSNVRQALHHQSQQSVTPSRSGPVRRTMVTRVLEAVKAVALCHNVTPVYEGEEGESQETEADMQSRQHVVYQASSPDEVALVKWTESVDLALVKRDFTEMQLKGPDGQLLTYHILHVFPFTSENKRMGIIVKEQHTGEITFYLKGADVVMTSIVQYNDWLEEECGNMAREGLRTLVVAKKVLTEEQYNDFNTRHHQAKMSLQERNSKVQSVIESLERDMTLLCLTGVEDKLQEGVRPTLEMLKNASIKVWMLTGDKLETAICIAKSSRLVSRLQDIHTFHTVQTREEAHLQLNALRRKNDNVLVISGNSLQVCLQFYEHEFVELACQCPCVVVCRCSPTQKAEVVKLLKTHTGKRTCAVGDGGNDVSMIQTADAGIGIVGKEGKQASLAADFSITQFSHIGRLLMVHGRNSYKRSAALSQFVIHRGLIISIMQAVFSSVFYFASVSLFPSLLLVGYGTVYTMYPVFSLVLDKDVSAEIAMTYPELYKELTKGRSLSFKTFFVWVLISMYQGGVLMFGALLLFDDEFVRVIDIAFTALLLTELLMVALTIRTWHYLMVVAQVLSVGIYVASIFILKEYFDPKFMVTFDFIWKVLLLTSVSCIPLYVIKYLRKKFSPPSYSKLT